MRFIPYSNGLHKLKTKKKREPWKIVEVIVFTAIILLAAGAIGQLCITKYNGENTKSRNMYVSIDHKKYYYSSRGNGDVTIVMDAALGSVKEEWNDVIRKLGVDFTDRIFTYDRSGYGYNDYEPQSIEEQARTLRLILKKSGQSSPYILVGDEYGSLVMSSFASLYPDEVAGIILVNPLNENYLGDKDYIKKYSKQKLSRYVQSKGAYISVTALLNAFDLVKNPSGLYDSFSEQDVHDFVVNKRESSYNSAYYNELNNIINFNSDKITQNKDTFKDKFISIISNSNNFGDKQEELKKLADKDKITTITVESNKDIITGDKSEIIADSINNMVKRYKAIAKTK